MTGPWLTRDSGLHPDGDRWIISQDVSASGGDIAADDSPEPERFLVVTNWFEELRERLGN